MKLAKLTLFLTIAFIASCSNPNHHQPTTLSKAALKIAQESKEKTVAFIYDYNKERLKLEWKACKINESSGDQLTDAIHAFIQENQIKGIGNDIQLEEIKQSNHPIVLSFSGKPNFKNQRDSTIFWTALDLTISRNSDQLAYDLRFE